MLKRRQFIAPSVPVLRSSPPEGLDWVHEVKFDGWRAQLHKDDNAGKIFSRNGNDLTRRFVDVRVAMESLPCQSVIVDAEIVECASDGAPDFNALMSGSSERLCAWCFDLLELDGRDLRPLPLVERKALLLNLLIDADDDTLRYSDDFLEPQKLLNVCNQMGLEGIVSKRMSQPYKSGRNVGWVKVKTSAWKLANKDQGELFEKQQNKRAASLR